MKTLTRRLWDATVAVVALCGAAAVTAQPYPNKTILIRVAYPAGFGVDTADAVVTRLSKAFQEWNDSPEYLALATAQGLRKLDSMTPQQAAGFLRAENEKFINIAKTLNLVAQ
jgi:tripartite-type tricarboxylate transporter receptor subunit TctC